MAVGGRDGGGGGGGGRKNSPEIVSRCGAAWERFSARCCRLVGSRSVTGVCDAAGLWVVTGACSADSWSRGVAGVTGGPAGAALRPACNAGLVTQTRRYVLAEGGEPRPAGHPSLFRAAAARSSQSVQSRGRPVIPVCSEPRPPGHPSLFRAAAGRSSQSVPSRGRPVCSELS